jgi:hypothetical protein
VGGVGLSVHSKWGVGVLAWGGGWLAERLGTTTLNIHAPVPGFEDH